MEHSRRFLRSAAVSIAVLLAAVACSSGSTEAKRRGQSLKPFTPPVLTAHPPVVDASKFETTTPIKHVVFIIKENRSFDNLFGTFPGADGATMANDKGKTRPLLHGALYEQRLPHDLPHDYIAAVKDYNHGKMDGFTTSSAADKY